MKFLRMGERGHEKTAVLDKNGKPRDLTPVVEDGLAGHPYALANIEKLKAVDVDTLPELDPAMRIGAAVHAPPNLLCIGLNYSRHAAEIGMANPEEPAIFSKATSCITGPNDTIALPEGSTRTDWEVELGLVIGRECHNISEAEALDHVSGYCLVNDISEREDQIDRGGQWIKGKSHPGFGPVGPWLVTADEIPDPQNLRLWLSVNGEMRQQSTTGDMIFTVAQCIAYLSRFMVLQVGDLIITGTPEGVGLGRKPQVFVKSGDEMRLGVDGLGEQHLHFI